jgi:cytochrome c oxidase subunit II
MSTKNGAIRSGLIALLFAVGGLALTTRTSAAQEAQVIEVTAKKYEFSPSPIHVKQGAKVQLKITATDHVHGFDLNQTPEGAEHGKEGLIFSSSDECYRIESGHTVTVEFAAQTAGTYDFKCCTRCGLHHGSMKGQLIVDP